MAARKSKESQAVPVAPPYSAGVCGNCARQLTDGWTQSPKGRVCSACWRGYMGNGWPGREPGSDDE